MISGPAQAHWGRELFPDSLDTATARLRSALMARVGSDGAIRDPCRSRILESVLALNLLERTGLQGERRERLVGYLRAQGATGRLDRLLVDLALTRAGAAGPPAGLAEAFLAQAPGFTGARKQAMFDATFALYDLAPRRPLDPRAFDLTGLHCWARVQVTAVKIVLADAAGRHDLISDEDVRILLETQRRGEVWESNVLINLWALHALHRLPHTEDVVAEGVATAMAHQRADGGMPFITDTDTWCTATAGVALAAASAPPETLHAIAAHLLAQQQPGGGWSYTDLSRQTDVDDTSVALQFLYALDADRYREPIRRGERSLRAVHNPDGGFPTYIAGAESEACMTAAAVDAFTPQWQRHHEIITAGLEFLADQQYEDGSFPPDWSSSRLHTIFRALLAATRNPGPLPVASQQMVKRIMTLVLAGQNADGGWGQQEEEPSDPISTAYALIVVCRQDDPVPAARAAAYLLAAQCEDGSIASIPDSIGPRPLRFTIPVLADIFTLLALGHLARRLGEGPREDDPLPVRCGFAACNGIDGISLSS
ncbi:prenyltransferase/squalene oxidase repeat-containing protein [Nocardia sp. NPDC051570]|uniref:prenyltransferase/squalene oxidase repeat-containing protein n=1 Tax=Nocardia sp. NPDC051570 TaxID=3364324 RepID=UPI0037ADE615